MPAHPCGLYCALFRYDIGTFVLLCRRLDSQPPGLKWATTDKFVSLVAVCFVFLKVMSSLALFCLSAVAHGVFADYCIHLLAYIRADEFKCCGAHRVLSQHKDKLAVSNCCTVMNADPPCTERYLHRWIPFQSHRFQQRLVCQSLCASYSLCFTDSKVKHFYIPSKR